MVLADAVIRPQKGPKEFVELAKEATLPYSLRLLDETMALFGYYSKTL